MGERTGIAWTNATWNPWMGCTRLSPGCAHCYMFSEQRRYGHDPSVVRRSKTKFLEPLHWSTPRLVFTCSWSDWFHPDADEWREEAWEVVRRTPHLTYQILTKRPERIQRRLPPDWGDGWPNVWLGTSVESQRFVWRAEVLVRIPAAVRFISAEPLLGPLELGDLVACDHPSCTGAEGPIDRLGRWPERWNCDGCRTWHRDEDLRPGIHWVIAGGESGPRCRPCPEAWLRSLRDECLEGRTPFFLKQLGGHPNKRADEQAVLDGRSWTQMPPASGPQ